MSQNPALPSSTSVTAFPFTDAREPRYPDVDCCEVRQPRSQKPVSVSCPPPLRRGVPHRGPVPREPQYTRLADFYRRGITTSAAREPIGGETAVSQLATGWPRSAGGRYPRNGVRQRRDIRGERGQSRSEGQHRVAGRNTIRVVSGVRQKHLQRRQQHTKLSIFNFIHMRQIKMAIANKLSNS